ncbi:glycoside hydrolase [Neoconidiobolus thromboides FSU 785]|nr:glycoside hydrolase [Neoconidiobolus thromboides FSU 785]
MQFNTLLLGLLTLTTQVLCNGNDKVVLGYYVPWGKMTPDQIQYNKLTHINYAFGTLTKLTNLTDIGFDIYYDGPHLRNLTKLAKQHNVKTLISLGGWTGSQTFSKIVTKKEYRTSFINNAIKFLRKNTKKEDAEQTEWDLDGIDIDWEYPGRKGDLCNIYSKEDSKNYLELLKELRCALDKEFPHNRKLLTAAVRVEPFDGPDGKPMNDVSEFAKYFDFINIMAYDISNGGNSTGPNAPLYSINDQGSFASSIEAWNKAGFPLNKLCGGLAFYGRAKTTLRDITRNSNTLVHPAESVIPQGDASDVKEVSKLCPAPLAYGGYYQYKNLRQDILKKDPFTPCSSSGYERYFDHKTQTPWLFNKKTKKFISYDDPKSIQIKVDYAKKMGLRGVMNWDLTTDYNAELLEACQSIRY